MTSPKRQLLEHVLPTVGADVAALIAAGKSWRQIADTISTASGVTVSHESMRSWYATNDAA